MASNPTNVPLINVTSTHVIGVLPISLTEGLYFDRIWLDAITV